MHVSFICTGNICRSPMAALVFRAYLHREGLDEVVEVTSAGTGPWHAGEPADPRTVTVLCEHGYDTDHVASQLDDSHLTADLLVAMDSGHQRVVRNALGDETSRRVRLLRSFDPASHEGAEVPDPYYGGDNGFEDVLGQVEAAMPGLVEWIRERL